MRPRMMRDLMTLLVHPLDDLRIARRDVIDGTFAHVVPCDEKGRLGVVAG